MSCKVPSMTFTELAGVPVKPDAGGLKLFVLSSNHEFYVINSSGGVSPLGSYVLGPALQSVEALEPISADQIIYTNGINTFNASPITLLARQLLDDADQATMLTTLGAQPLSADLTAFVTNASWSGANVTFNGSLTAFGVTCAGSFVSTGPAQFDSDITCDGQILASGVIGSPTFTVASGPTITSGSGVPASAEPDGSLYLRSGTPNGSLYVRQNGAWVLK